MRNNILTLVVAGLLAFGASGVVAASVSPGPQMMDANPSSVDEVLPENHTSEVIDPHDRLSEQEVKDAQQLAWANENVTSYFEDSASVHFQVEALGDELQVYVAPQETAAPRVMAVIEMDSQSVVTVEQLQNVKTADDVRTAKPSSGDLVISDGPSEFISSGEFNKTQYFAENTTETESGESATFVSSGELSSTQISTENMTVLENGEDITFVSEDEMNSQEVSSETIKEGFSNEE
ncbi:hypothetical protein [Halostagnicola kamekurae]|uniref:Uncharacterized protein n=1 Tax=Halostagnicola kamekurae TaxID=619731 RepID=A0A1I6QP58_9EURY|nr:hypothetical protein [Halostagnicola kamekurae]SFS54179.1 hypothetical protein SAMN04488556_1414 [Halostagnicola kamekurae]